RWTSSRGRSRRPPGCPAWPGTPPAPAGIPPRRSGRYAPGAPYVSRSPATSSPPGCSTTGRWTPPWRRVPWGRPRRWATPRKSPSWYWPARTRRERSDTPELSRLRGVAMVMRVRSVGKDSERSADAHSAAPLDRAAFLFAHSAPHAGVLTGVERPLEALVGRGTAPADRLGLLDLQQGRTGRPDREEQLRVLIAAGSTVAPVHGGNTPWLVDRSRCAFLYPSRGVDTQRTTR